MEADRRAYQLALRILTRRDHSVAELREKLAAKGVEPPAASEALGRLVAAGYLDDRRFAVSFAAAALRNGRGFGPRLKLELRRRGVADGIIAETLAELAQEHGEEEVLAQIVSRRFGTFVPTEAPERERRRVFGYLQRRGFSLAAILAHFRIRSSEE